MKKICQSMVYIIFIVMIILFIPNNSFAGNIINGGNTTKTNTTKNSTSSSNSTSGGTTYDESLGDLDQYKGTTMDSKKLEHMGKGILSVIQVIGTVLSVVILIIIGIKYMLGSVEEKADYKKTMMPYIYGTLFLFAGSQIPQIIYEFVKNIGW